MSVRRTIGPLVEILMGSYAVTNDKCTAIEIIMIN